MKILFVNYEYPPLGGGGGVINELLAKELAQKHEVTVLTSQALGLPREEWVNGIRIVRVPVFFRHGEVTANLASMYAFIVMGILKGRKLIQQNSYDVINTHFALPSGHVGDTLAWFANIPNILSLHGGDLYDPSKFISPHRHIITRAWIRFLIHRADAVIGQSKNTLTNMERYYSSKVRGICIPLGICKPAPGSASRDDYGIGENEVILVTVGRLVRRKAVDQLLRMMSTLRNEKVRLLILGSGPEGERLKELALRLDLGNRVQFLGFVEEKEKFRILEMADIYVSTTQHEGFCLSFLEAMSKSLPVISYNHGGHIDYLVDGETGFLVPLNNLDLFQERVRLLARNRSLRREMGALNLERVGEYFIETCAARYEDIFMQVVGLRRPTGQDDFLRTTSRFDSR